jgi:NhaP-type Na+/H+ or K+/H+ antiporter
MGEYPIIAFAALLILGYGLFSKAAEKSVITAPMIFVSVGILTSFFVGEKWLEGINANWVAPIAEITLVLVLFTDASTLDRKFLLKDSALPLRLLLIGLPITMVLGIFIAFALFPGIDKWQLAMMAIILSPTDAALGLAVVTSKIVPPRIRQAINTESGLNDGIALPPLLVCLAVLSADPGGHTGFAYWGMFTLKQFVFGPLIGGLVGWTGGWLVDHASKRGWMNHAFQSLASISMAILAYALAEAVHGNGFIAAFFAGLMLGTQTAEIRDRIHEFGEAESQALILFIFLLMGLVLIPNVYHLWDINALVYAILSLTVIRMLPVALSLLGTKLDWKTIHFIGWFGPRGIASVLYVLLVINRIGKQGHEQVIAVISLTVLLSIFLHGITAIPFSKSFENKTSG